MKRCWVFLLVLLCHPAWADPENLDVLEQQMLGGKFSGQPETVRLQQLEQAFGQPADGRDTETYRLARLYSVQQAAVSAQTHQQAVQAYNLGVDEELNHQADKAIAAYRKTIQLDPNLVQAYNNLANLLQQQQRYDETADIYRQAILKQPKEPLLHRNLGLLYEKTGRIQDAIREYQTYLKLAEKPDPPIQSIVENYQRNRKPGTASADYLSAATDGSHGQQLIWPGRNNPVKVFIEARNPDQLTVYPLISQCMQEWEKATSGRVQFVETGNEAKANIHIVLRPGPLMDPYIDIGHTEYAMPEEQLEHHQLDKVSITLNTGLPEHEQGFTPESREQQIHRMALHELGHAIGIWGHSPDPDDIMFTHPIASRLSSRDIQTVRKLYGL